jgi:hypothetical protein
MKYVAGCQDEFGGKISAKIRVLFTATYVEEDGTD